MLPTPSSHTRRGGSGGCDPAGSQAVGAAVVSQVQVKEAGDVGVHPESERWNNASFVATWEPEGVMLPDGSLWLVRAHRRKVDVAVDTGTMLVATVVADVARIFQLASWIEKPARASGPIAGPRHQGIPS
jgi:hypothetical protein